MADHWHRVASIFLSFLLFLLFDCTVQQQQQVPISWQERLALIQLRSSLGIRAIKWPIKSDPCISWKGIQCSNGRVRGINISGFRRTRQGSTNPQFAVDALRNLTLLSEFNASNFALPGPIPQWFGLQLGALQVLDLRSCSINGAIPATIGNLTSLLQLYLSDNDLSGDVPLSLSRLVGLSVLDLSRNSLTGSIPGGFSALMNLTVLDMSLNRLSGVIPPGIGALSRLQLLNLSNNSLTGLIPAGFSALVNLTVLDMSLNQLSGAIPPGIGALSRLQLLNLSNNGLSSSIPAQLGSLSSLVDLDLGFNLLSGAVPLDLRGLRSLRRMIIGDNLLSRPLPGNLFDTLTQLQFVVLRRNRFTGGLPSVLWSIRSLRFLDVSANNFTDMLPNVSSSVDASSSMANISRNLFYGNITPVVRRFGSIDMSGNYFEGPVPSYASANASLTRNCLRNTTNQRSLAECTSFYAERNLVFDNFGQPNAAQPPPPRSNRRKNRSAIIYGSIFGGIGLLLLLMLPLILLIVWKRNRGTSNQRGISVGPVPAGGSPSPPSLLLNLSTVGDTFTYKQILQITGEFNDENLIKHGHSGDIFRGVLEGGLEVVVKKVDLNSSIKKDSYMSELDLFSKVSHSRLVPFLGHCLENENAKFLVYKCMPNGNLSTALFKKTSTDSLQSLDWITRLKIAIGAAEGLSYLHHECSPPLVHRDIQASSILLDDKYEVRLGSLSEVCVQEGDSHQSRITRLLRLPQSSEQGSSGTPNASCAYDVYCFGKVLLELVTGMLGISSSTDATTREWLDKTLPYISIYDKELVTNIIDPSLIIDEDLLEEVWAMAIVARSCLNPKPARRPLMRYILKALENPLKVVRDEHNSSARLRTASSRGSWNANTLFGSWRLSSSDVATTMATPSRRVEHASSFKQSGTTGSQGSGQIGDGNGVSPSTRRNSKEIFPEPVVQRLNGD